MLSGDYEQNLAFLMSCSRTSLADFLLAKQNRAANVEKNICDLMGQLSESLVLIELACSLRSDGENVRNAENARGAADLAQSPTGSYPPPYGWHWILNRGDLTLYEKLVLLGLKRFCNQNHMARVAHFQLTKATGISRAKVKRCLKQLIEKKFLLATYTGRASRFWVLSPPADLSIGSSGGATTAETRWLPGSYPVALAELPEPSGSSGGATLSVIHGNPVRHRSAGVTPPSAFSEGQNLSQIQPPGLGQSLNPKEIALRRELAVGIGPQTTAGVRPEVIERDRRRRERERRP
jgi:hypothetical protein